MLSLILLFQHHSNTADYSSPLPKPPEPTDTKNVQAPTTDYFFIIQMFLKLNLHFLWPGEISILLLLPSTAPTLNQFWLYYNDHILLITASWSTHRTPAPVPNTALAPAAASAVITLPTTLSTTPHKLLPTALTPYYSINYDKNVWAQITAPWRVITMNIVLLKKGWQWESCSKQTKVFYYPTWTDASTLKPKPMIEPYSRTYFHLFLFQGSCIVFLNPIQFSITLAYLSGCL